MASQSTDPKSVIHAKIVELARDLGTTHVRSVTTSDSRHRLARFAGATRVDPVLRTDIALDVEQEDLTLDNFGTIDSMAPISTSTPNARSHERAWPDGKRLPFRFLTIRTRRHSHGPRRLLVPCRSWFSHDPWVWPLGPIREVNSPGETCANASYLTHNLELQKLGFEIGYHNATPHSSVRDETKQALDLFKGYFGQDPRSMANHYNREAIYWDRRGSRPRQNAIQRLDPEQEQQPLPWGDRRRSRILGRPLPGAHRVLPQFRFPPISTRWRPVPGCVSRSIAAVCPALVLRVGRQQRQEFRQHAIGRQPDRLEEEGGACILYTHFGHGFVEDQKLDSRFSELMTRLSQKTAGLCRSARYSII